MMTLPMGQVKEVADPAARDAVIVPGDFGKGRTGDVADGSAAAGSNPGIRFWIINMRVTVPNLTIRAVITGSRQNSHAEHCGFLEGGADRRHCRRIPGDVSSGKELGPGPTDREHRWTRLARIGVDSAFESKDPPVLIPGGEVNGDVRALRDRTGNFDVQGYFGVVETAGGVGGPIDADVREGGSDKAWADAQSGGEVGIDVAGQVAACTDYRITEFEQADGLLAHVMRRCGEVIELRDLGRRKRRNRGKGNDGAMGHTASVQAKYAFDSRQDIRRQVYIALVSAVDLTFRPAALFAAFAALAFLLGPPLDLVPCQFHREGLVHV